MDSKERKGMRDASQKKVWPSGISDQISRLVIIESDLYGKIFWKKLAVTGISDQMSRL